MSNSRKIAVSDPSVSIGINEEKDADIRFFIKANPNFRKGHGLITLTPMNKKNVMVLVKRFGAKISKNIAAQGILLTQSIQLKIVRLNNLLSPSI